MDGNSIVASGMSGLTAWSQTQLTSLILLPAYSLGIAQGDAVRAAVIALTSYRMYSVYCLSAV